MMVPPGMVRFRESDLIPISDNKLNREPTITQEEIDVKGHTDEYKVYEYPDDNIKIYSNINIDDYLVNEVKTHYNKLPMKLRNNVSEIVITKRGTSMGWVEESEIQRGMKRLYVNPRNCTNEIGKTYKDTIIHEIAHLMDINQSLKFTISDNSFFKTGFNSDDTLMLSKKLKGYDTDYSRKNIFSSRYAYRSYSRYPDRPYSEEWAEAVMKYLNPKTHESFVAKFPHKAEVLRNIIYF